MIQKIETLLASKPVILQLLKFACIGALNTAVDFIILNFLTVSLSITGGWQLAAINTVGVIVAILQSYFWNRSWAFGVDVGVRLWKQFSHLVLVGGLGFLSFVAVLLGAGSNAPASYFGLLLFAFVVIQLAFIITFHLQRNQQASSLEFEKFVLVSLVGVGINSLILWVGVEVLTGMNLPVAEALVKNIAKFGAVLVSLVWNFIGYKFLVFKR